MIATKQKTFAYDHKLPALPYATDDIWMSMLFNSRPDILRSLGLCGPISVNHELLKYTPGKRCVFHFELRNSHEHKPRELIGKLYRDDRGAAIFERMMALWCGRLRNKMPRPLQYFSALGLILQLPAAGRPLAEMINTETAVTLSNAIETTAQNLALLHATPLPELATRQRMVDHLAKYCRPHPQQLIAELATEHPILSQQCATIVQVLYDTDILENEPLVTVHNDLNLAHIYWESDKAFFIDLDGLCRSHAALDLATFRIALRIYLGEQGRELGDHFLESYVAAGGVTAVAALQLYESFVYLRRATICYRKRAENSDWLQDLTILLDNGLNALSR